MILPGNPALRRQQIEFQIGLASALMHTKGMAAPETTAVLEEARLLIERAEALGQRTDNPLLLFRLLEGFWLTSYLAFNGDAMRERATHLLALAEKQAAIIPLIMGNRVMGVSLMWTGNRLPKDELVSIKQLHFMITPTTHWRRASEQTF